VLVNLKEILKFAGDNKIAVGAFNTPNLECATAILSASETLEMPVMITHAQLHETISPLTLIGPIMIRLAEKSSQLVCVHLDHGESLDYLKTALDMGFTGIMYDGSLLDYEENAENTRKAVEMAKAYNVGVEAEIGVLGGREAGASDADNAERLYTDPALALRFVEDTQIDALACSFGTAHGIYKAKPKLDFKRLAKINELVKVPLVMHGGSGCSEEDYMNAITHGVRKINYYSYMARAGVTAVKEFLEKTEVTFFHELAACAETAMKKDAMAAMKIFGAS
jgi:fructose-bisphosphate aldolase class II